MQKGSLSIMSTFDKPLEQRHRADFWFSVWWAILLGATTPNSAEDEVEAANSSRASEGVALRRLRLAEMF